MCQLRVIHHRAVPVGALRLTQVSTYKSASIGTWTMAPHVLATVRGLVPGGTIGGVRATVLIVDDHDAFRASARALLEAEGFEVVGEAADGAGALEAVAALRPQIVLLDIKLPDLDGLTVAEQLARAEDPPVVVLISSRDAAAYGPRLHQAPARGFIPKSGLSGEALSALIG